MKHYESSARIDASPEAVWQVLTDGAAYPTWDSGVERVEGTIADGETIKVFSEVDPGRAFPVKVGDVEPARLMRWRGGMPLGLFRGVRTFTLTPTETGGTAFTMREEYTGPLVGLIWKSMPNLQPSFTRFAGGLKERAESGQQ
jgi:hypothetical protein